MCPHQENIPETVDLFRSQLDQIINMEHELVALARAIDWDHLNEKNSAYYHADGHTLKPMIESMMASTGIEPERIYVDKGYRGHDYPKKLRVFKSGQRRGVTDAIKRELKRRSVIEPIIGHVKHEHRLGRNYLYGIIWL